MFSVQQRIHRVSCYVSFEFIFIQITRILFNRSISSFDRMYYISKGVTRRRCFCPVPSAARVFSTDERWIAVAKSEKKHKTAFLVNTAEKFGRIYNNKPWNNNPLENYNNQALSSAPLKPSNERLASVWHWRLRPPPPVTVWNSAVERIRSFSPPTLLKNNGCQNR